MLEISNKLLKFYFFIFLVAGVISSVVALGIDSRFNHREYNLLMSPNIKTEIAGYTKEKKQLSRSHHQLSVRCDATDLSTVYMCGVVFWLSPADSQQLYTSLEKYKSIHINAAVSSSNPDFDGRTRVTIKSLINPKGSLSDNANLKYQSIRFNRHDVQDAKLSNFKVATWWIDQYKIPFEKANLDLSKVVSVEVYVNDVPLIYPGNYVITIDDLKLTGHYIRYSQLKSWMFVLWPILIFGCLGHYVWGIRKAVKATKAKMYIDKATGFYNLDCFYEDYTIAINGSNPHHLYMAKVNNFDYICKHMGEEVACSLLQCLWHRISMRLGVDRLMIYRVSARDYLISVAGDKLTNEQIDFIFSNAVEGGCIDGVGQLSIKLQLVFIERSLLPETVEQVLELCELTVQQSDRLDYHMNEYHPSLVKADEEETFIANSVKQALDHNEFYLVFMPVWRSDKQNIAGAEALLRCRSQHLADYSPEVYIRVAEKKGLIKHIDLWVIENAFKALRDHAHHIATTPFRLSINISSYEILDNLFIENLRVLTTLYDIDPNMICLEITETFFVDLNEFAFKNIEEIRRLGFLVSLDDFGTGYTSFGYLMNIPANEIKIDRSYVQRLGEPNTDVVVRSMIDISVTFGYELVAEGVETLEQLKTLMMMGCDCFQGYYISQPTSFEEVFCLRDNELRLS